MVDVSTYTAGVGKIRVANLLNAERECVKFVNKLFLRFTLWRWLAIVSVYMSLWKKRLKIIKIKIKREWNNEVAEKQKEGRKEVRGVEEEEEEEEWNEKIVKKKIMKRKKESYEQT